MTTTKCCTKCGETKPIAKFPPHPYTRDRRQSWCSDCNNRRKLERARATRAKWAAIAAEAAFA
jgi:hypothetical protein